MKSVSLVNFKRSISDLQNLRHNLENLWQESCGGVELICNYHTFFLYKKIIFLYEPYYLEIEKSVSLRIWQVGSSSLLSMPNGTQRLFIKLSLSSLSFPADGDPQRRGFSFSSSFSLCPVDPTLHTFLLLFFLPPLRAPNSNGARTERDRKKEN